MEKGYVMKQLEKNEIDHQRLGDKVDRLGDSVNANHLELIKKLGENQMDTTLLKAKIGFIGIGFGSVPLIADAFMKHFK